MGNPILDKVEECVGLVTQLRAANDSRLEELEKGNKARADEYAQKVARIEVDVSKALKQRDDMTREITLLRERLEMTEAALDRPKGSISERLEGEYTKLFLKALRSGFKDNEITTQMRQVRDKQREVSEYKDVTLASNIGGGYGLPKEIGAEVDKLILAMSDIVNQVKNIQVGTSDYQELVSIFGGNSSWVAETAARTPTGTPNLRNCKPTWGELYAYPQVSEWSLQDIFFDVANWLTNDVADGMAVALSTAIWNGNGVARPTGMTNTPPVAVVDYASPMRAAAAYEKMILTSLTSPVKLNMDSLIALVYKLRPGYRSNGKFAMSSATQGVTRALKSSQGIYYWEPSLQIGQPDRLLGYPVFTWEDMGSGTTDLALAAAFGDWKRAYLLTYRTELMITQEGFTSPGFIKFYVRRRYAGIPLNNDAVKFLQVSD
jgi:HK97 family phage major capsid protein